MFSRDLGAENGEWGTSLWLGAARNLFSSGAHMTPLDRRGGSHFLDKGWHPEIVPGPVPALGLALRSRAALAGADLTHHQYHRQGALWASLACFCPCVWKPQNHTHTHTHVYFFLLVEASLCLCTCELENPKLLWSLLWLTWILTLALAGIWGLGPFLTALEVSPKNLWREGGQLPSGGAWRDFWDLERKNVQVKGN